MQIFMSFPKMRTSWFSLRYHENIWWAIAPLVITLGKKYLILHKELYKILQLTRFWGKIICCQVKYLPIYFSWQILIAQLHWKLWKQKVFNIDKHMASADNCFTSKSVHIDNHCARLNFFLKNFYFQIILGKRTKFNLDHVRSSVLAIL